MYLLDSSLLIKWLRKDQRAFELFETLSLEKVSISEITAFEILIGARSNQQLQSAKKLLEIFNRVPVNTEVTRATAQLCIKYPQIINRKIEHTLFDAFIAATGIVNRLEVITLNIRHFAILKQPRLRIRVLDENAEKWV